MRHLAVHGHFQLQAAIVRRHYFVAEARGDQQVGLGQALGQQPARPEQPAELFVIREVQLDRAMAGLGHGFQRAHRERETGEGSCCQPSPGGTTSPWALSAMRRPGPYSRRTIRLVMDSRP
ncbi:hypothetical protein G6F57_022092 [Rhizopus arrhizus]|nr:hypothetical protein G6F57_022092 [Rhizopus arrhizus]